MMHRGVGGGGATPYRAETLHMAAGPDLRADAAAVDPAKGGVLLQTVWMLSRAEKQWPRTPVLSVIN